MILSNTAILKGYKELTEDLGETPETAMKGLEIVSNFIAPLRCGKCAERKPFCTGCKSTEYSDDADETIKTIKMISDSIKETNQMGIKNRKKYSGS